MIVVVGPTAVTTTADARRSHQPAGPDTLRNARDAARVQPPDQRLHHAQLCTGAPRLLGLLSALPYSRSVRMIPSIIASQISAAGYWPNVDTTVKANGNGGKRRHLRIDLQSELGFKRFPRHLVRRR